MSEREEDELLLDPAEAEALRQALRPFDAPAGFTERVMAKATGSHPAGAVAPAAKPITPTAKLLQWPHSRLWISGLIAAALVAGIFEGEVTFRRVREQQRRIQQATEQFQMTERITVHALAQAREQLQRAGVPLNLD